MKILDEFDVCINSNVNTLNRNQLKNFLFENQYHLNTADKPNIGDWQILDKNNQYVGLLVTWNKQQRQYYQKKGI